MFAVPVSGRAALAILIPLFALSCRATNRVPASMPADLVITGATLIDGTGTPSRPGHPLPPATAASRARLTAKSKLTRVRGASLWPGSRDSWPCRHACSLRPRWRLAETARVRGACPASVPLLRRDHGPQRRRVPRARGPDSRAPPLADGSGASVQSTGSSVCHRSTQLEQITVTDRGRLRGLSQFLR